MMKEFFTFPDKTSAQEFCRLETPIEGVDIGGGIHVPKEMSMTTHITYATKHPKEEVWLVEVSKVAAEKTGEKLEVAEALLKEVPESVQIPK